MPNVMVAAFWGHKSCISGDNSLTKLDKTVLLPFFIALSRKFCSLDHIGEWGQLNGSPFIPPSLSMKFLGFGMYLSTWIDFGMYY